MSTQCLLRNDGNVCSGVCECIICSSLIYRPTVVLLRKITITVTVIITMTMMIMTMTTRSTRTVQTSTKARLTSEAIWRISMSSRFRSVNHSVSHIRDESGKQSLYPDGDPDCHRNLGICSLAHSQTSMKISCKSVPKFLRKAANRQTKKTTKTDPLWR